MGLRCAEALRTWFLGGFWPTQSVKEETVSTLAVEDTTNTYQG